MKPISRSARRLTATAVCEVTLLLSMGVLLLLSSTEALASVYSGKRCTMVRAARIVSLRQNNQDFLRENTLRRKTEEWGVSYYVPYLFQLQKTRPNFFGLRALGSVL